MDEYDLSSFAKEDLPVLRDFWKWLKAAGRAEGTRTAYYYSLRGLAECMDGPLTSATKEDMVEAVGAYSDRVAENTLKNRMAKVKRFYKWMNGGDGYPEEVDWVDTTSNSSAVLPSNLLSKGEVKRMIDSCNHPHDEALIATLYESGLRASEFVSLNIGSVEFGENIGQVIIPKGSQRLKTGQRRVPLVNSVPYLQEWINRHPGGKTEPLWINLGWNRRHERLTYGGFKSKVKRIASDAGIEKNVWPHLFRHSRATEVAKKGFSEAEMRIIFGWAENSDMPSKYIHLAGKDVDEKFKKIHGVVDAEGEEETDPLEPAECPRCGHENSAGTVYCNKCGLALDEKAAIEAERKKSVKDIVMEEMDGLDSVGTFEELLNEAVEKKVKEVLAEEG